MIDLPVHFVQKTKKGISGGKMFRLLNDEEIDTIYRLGWWGAGVDYDQALLRHKGVSGHYRGVT